jgi:uncharacterized protein
MQFNLDSQADANLVTHIGPDGIRIGAVSLDRSFIVSSAELLRDWPVADAGSVDLAALESALALHPEILILGTGARIEFPDASLFSALAERNIGLEVMDTAAACRTYNVLVAELRPVVAAIIFPAATRGRSPARSSVE